MASNLNVTELDFKSIKDNLKNFLKQQSEFNDYDFEGAGHAILLMRTRAFHLPCL